MQVASSDDKCGRGCQVSYDKSFNSLLCAII